MSLTLDSQLSVWQGRATPRLCRGPGQSRKYALITLGREAPSVFLTLILKEMGVYRPGRHRGLEWTQNIGAFGQQYNLCLTFFVCWSVFLSPATPLSDLENSRCPLVFGFCFSFIAQTLLFLHAHAGRGSPLIFRFQTPRGSYHNRAASHSQEGV